MTAEIVDIVHKECGGVAFRVSPRPASGDIMDASTVVWPVNKIRTGDYISCFSCGQRIESPLDIEIVGGFRDQQTEETHEQQADGPNGRESGHDQP